MQNINYIHQYIKNSKNQPVGVLLAAADPNTDEVYIGWSKCNTGKERFDHKRGVDIALGRSLSMQGRDYHLNLALPNPIDEHYPDFVDRCHKYFKNKIVQF